MKSLIALFALTCSLSTMTAAASESCNIEVVNTKSLILNDGSVDDEAAFLSMAQNTLVVCKSQAANWNSVKETINNAKKSCDESANQGMSQLYRGTCYLKVSELATFILGR